MLPIALLIAIHLPQQGLSKRIDFTSVAKPAKQMLAELSEKAGLTLMTSQVMEGEVLVLHLEAVPVADAMRRIAAVTAGEWLQEPGGYRLARSKTKLAENVRKVEAEGIAAIKKSTAQASRSLTTEKLMPENAVQTARDLIRLSERLVPGKYDPEVRGTALALDRNSAAGRLSSRLLKMVEPAELVHLQHDERLVFSTRPNKMQRAFKGDARKMLAQYAADHNVWLDALQKAEEELGPPKQFISSSIQLPYRSSVVAEPIKALMVFTSDGIGHSMRVELSVWDAEGRIISTDFTRVADEALRNLDKAAETPRPQAPPLVLSALSKELEQVLKSRGEDLASVSVQLRQRLLQPEKHDPLSLIPSELWLGTAKTFHKNLVASLPEEASNWNYMTAAPPSAGAFLKLMSALPVIDVKEEDNWLEVAPSDLSAATEKRVDRQALGVFLRRADKHQTVDLDTACRFALSLKGRNKHWPVVGFLTSTLISNLDASAWGNDINVLRLYGTLNPIARSTLINGGRLAFHRLNPEQRAYAERLLFTDSPVFRVRASNGVTGEQMSHLMRNLFREPTEVMPNGLESDGYFTLSSQIKQTIFVYSTKESGYRAMPMDPRQVGHMLYMASDLTRFPSMVGQPTLDLFHVGEQTELTFAFEVADAVYVEKPIRYSSVDTSKPPGPLSDLPETLRKAIEEQFARSKQGAESQPIPQKKPPPPKH
jgi:hypothetical protein